MAKNQKILFVFLFIISYLIFSSAVAMAADTNPNDLKPPLKVKIGQQDWEFNDIDCSSGTCSIDWISQYVVAIYKYGIGLAAVLAVVVIMVGGFIWLMSGGSSTRVSTAKDFVLSALSGLLLALFSFMLLYLINPRLTQMESVLVERLNQTGTEHGPQFYLISPTYENGDEAKIKDHCKRYCEVEYSSTDYQLEKDASGWYRCYCGSPDIKDYVVKDQEMNAKTEQSAYTACEALCFDRIEADVAFVTEVNFIRAESDYNVYNCSCYRVR